MSGIRELYSRFRHLIHEGAKFLVVGGIGTVVTFGVANALHGIGPYKAVTIATILATVITFIGNRYWSFRHRQGHGTARETIVFFILNGIGLLIYYACIWMIKDAAGLTTRTWYNFALVLGTGLGTLFRFWSYRKWVWGATRGQPPGATSGAGQPGPPLAGPEQERLTPAAVQAERDGLTSAAAPAGRPPGAHRRQ